MDRLTFEGDFCDIAQCFEVRGGSLCEDGTCSQRRVWERLKQYEDAEEAGRLIVLSCEVDAEKGWYRKLFYCPCGQHIKTETWDEKYCFGSGTVLKGNVMPKHCPNCGAKMDLEVNNG